MDVCIAAAAAATNILELRVLTGLIFKKIYYLKGAI